MSEQLLDLLKLCLLALLYLFFLRVIWAVWTELRAPAVAAVASEASSARRRVRPTAATSGPATVSLGTLRVLEPAEHAGRTHAVTAEMTIGRAPGCSIVVDDTFVSQIHARVFGRGDDVVVEDLGSTNGTLLNGHALTAPQVLARGDRLQIGSTVLELVR